MKQKRRKREFNDLMIPIIFVIGILPFITRLIVYESGLSKYSWFSENDITTDFFAYYKSISFLIIALISAVILLFFFLFYRAHWKNMRSYLPLGVYFIATLFSTLFSIDTHTSFVGGMGHFENVFVLLGYIILSVYTYQVVKTEEDYHLISKVIIISVSVMCIIGFFQMIGQDLIGFEWVQKFIIPKDYWSSYLGAIKSRLITNAVSLTLFNPNYAAVYLAMLIPFLLALMIPGKENKVKSMYLVLIGIMIILLYKTYSRIGLLSISISFLVLGYFYRNYLKHRWKQMLVLFFLFMCLLTMIDSSNDFRYIKKLVSTIHSLNGRNDNDLEEILTTQENIFIRYKGEELYVSFPLESTKENILSFSNHTGDDISKFYDAKTNTLALEPFDKLEFEIEKISKESFIIVKINDINWTFAYDKSLGYQYYNDIGKYDTLKPIEAFGFDGYENIASGRGYIWSRSIPLLKHNPIIGSGPDTFPLIYPQWDYVGKANNCKTPYTIIESPHSLYLSIGLQTGMISLIAIMVFFITYIVKSVIVYRKCSWDNYIERVGLGCLVACISFMVSGLFNDSTIQTSPIFWVLLGLGMAANHKIMQYRKNA